ncbi:MAG: septal ring lytic transglycosylase RlpA family protein [Gallionella sp.]
MYKKAALLFATTLLLAACGTVPQRKAVTPGPTGGGGYLTGDGPGKDIPAHLDAIPDAVPKIEPLNPYANRPYIALGKTYTPMTVVGNFREQGIASWYGKKFNGSRTSSGEIYDMYAMTAAHPTLPLPSYARVTNLANHKSVVVRINDRGPFMKDRIIDLSYTAAYKLGIVGDGSAEVEVDSIDPNVTVNSIAASTVQSQPLDSHPINLAPVAPVPAAASAVVAATAAVPAADAVSAAASPASAPAATGPAIAPLASSDTEVYLQLGAFKTLDAAEAYLAKMRSELGDIGKQLKLSTKDGLIRVHIGPYANQSEARSSADSMEAKLGFKPMVNLP